MDSNQLRKLSRAKIQSIAKRERVRAVGRTEDIIFRLLSKYPKGVPVLEGTNSIAGSPIRRRSQLKRESTSSVLNQPLEGTSCDVPLPVAENARATAGLPTNQVCDPPSNGEADDAKVRVSSPHVENGPDEYMVVDALREFTGLVNDVPVMWERIRETQQILDRTASLIDQMTPDLCETCVVREKLEVFLLAKMKKKPELWDGTAHLNKKDRKFRVEWLRSERKAETIKKWQEDNEGFKHTGQSPEPYENYA
ncbi:hypothetical protein J3A83DRAFT_4208517 [Scleroderma citrinum]